MNSEKKLIIITNESISKEENSFYCDNVDMKSIPEGLSNKLEISMISRNSNIKRSYQIKLKNISVLSNIFAFLFCIYKTFKYKKTNYLLISITPYTFLSYLFLFIFRKKIFVYLRSNGHEEYKAIFGIIGFLIYHVMYICVTFKSNIIVCQSRLVKNKKIDLVFPSRLDENWLKTNTKLLLDKPRLLYVGRIRVEKGIFSLFKLYDEMTIDLELSIVGRTEDLKAKVNKKINFLGFGYDTASLIKVYDNHNIFILPSFTEAHPQVLNESLARKRPVIIFEEISHIIKNMYGVFISKRNVQSLTETIAFIMNNYSTIQESMSQNKLPTRLKFISQMTDILS